MSAFRDFTPLKLAPLLSRDYARNPVTAREERNRAEYAKRWRARFNYSRRVTEQPYATPGYAWSLQRENMRGQSMELMLNDLENNDTDLEESDDDV